MGNAFAKINSCCGPGAISSRHDIAVLYSVDKPPTDDGLGHSFCYIRPHPYSASFTTRSKKVHSEDAHSRTFRSISGASVSANTYNPLTTSLFDLYTCTTTFDKASAFESSTSFASIPLQPVPKINMPTTAAPGSGPIEKGFLSGPIERGLCSGPMEKHMSDQPRMSYRLSKKQRILSIFKKILQPKKRVQSGSGSGRGLESGGRGLERTLRSDSMKSSCQVDDEEEELDDDDDDECFKSQNLQWAQGKAGEDRVHVVISEEHGWVFVGIYDGFNGPDAPDYLLANLYSTIHKELEGLMWRSDEPARDSFECERDWERSVKLVESVEHSQVLKALVLALMKTEEGFLEIADKMVTENPELALMGSCVLVMLMKGEDVYLMNVGDSRAVLAQKADKSDSSTSERFVIHDCDFDNLPSILTSIQLTVDHSTNEQQEVEKILKEHPDDPCVIVKDRVKGSLKVTRAFGAGFLKQRKWNNALLEAFRIDYTSEFPYITCSPSLQHHRLGPTDRFLILSSDGLYQYFTNQEAVSEVELFMVTFPEGDPAQHLIEEVLFRAAKKAGIDFHDLLDIPQGDRRRRYHDDVSVIIISLEGRIWRSSM
uniref:PPM-type phosphatase domain-containing protein n=1 Tax=Kalanchoe fedtschenkoi TaxID=63787 RepID=A0A7N0TU18_KALFE